LTYLKFYRDAAGGIVRLIFRKYDSKPFSPTSQMKNPSSLRKRDTSFAPDSGRSVTEIYATPVGIVSWMYALATHADSSAVPPNMTGDVPSATVLENDVPHIKQAVITAWTELCRDI
jgi:hypothetical protein